MCKLSFAIGTANFAEVDRVRSAEQFQMDGIPEPKNTGSAGTQEPTAPEVIPPEASSPTAGLPFVQKLEGLAVASPRSLGGEVSAHLIAASASQMSYYLARTELELQQAKNRLDETKEHLSQSKQKCGVLSERLKSHRRTRHIRNAGVAFGTMLIAMAVDLDGGSIDIRSFVLIFLGLSLIVLGWFAFGGEDEE